VPAIIVYGEEGDFLAPMSLTFSSDLGERGHFNVVCTHDFGHGIAPTLTPSIWDFLEAHRFGEPSPWSDGLPAGYDDGCVIGPVEPPDPPDVPVTDEGVGTPCETDEDCPGGDVDFCLSQLNADGYCTIEGCAAGGCEGPFVCCHDCTGPAAGMLPFEGSVCVFDELTSTLTATPVGCTCD
jgi:hypothetical protein